MMAMLNTREHAHSLATVGTSLGLGSANFAMNSRLQNTRDGMDPIGVNVSVAKETLRDRVDDTKYRANHEGGAFV